METDPAGQVRLDKWLWAARFFKSRSLASQAVGSGRVRVNGNSAKPSRTIAIGDTLSIQKGPQVWAVVVRAISTRRQGAPLAAALYEETAESRVAREAAMAERKARRAGANAARVGARPSKKDRRQMERWREPGEEGF